MQTSQCLFFPPGTQESQASGKIIVSRFAREPAFEPKPILPAAWRWGLLAGKAMNELLRSDFKVFFGLSGKNAVCSFGGVKFNASAGRSGRSRNINETCQKTSCKLSSCLFDFAQLSEDCRPASSLRILRTCNRREALYYSVRLPRFTSSYQKVCLSFIASDAMHNGPAQA